MAVEVKKNYQTRENKKKKFKPANEWEILLANITSRCGVTCCAVHILRSTQGDT